MKKEDKGSNLKALVDGEGCFFPSVVIVLLGLFWMVVHIVEAVYKCN